MKSIVSELRGPSEVPPRRAAPVTEAPPAVEAPVGAEAPREPAVLTATVPGTYTTVTDLAELDRWIAGARGAGLFAFDVETDSTDEMNALPLGFSLSHTEGRACYVPVRASGVSCLPEDVVRQRLAGLLSDRSLKLVGQNIKFDYKVLSRWGITPANVHFDTMVAAWVLDSEQSSYGLDRLAELHLGYRTTAYEELVGKKSGLTLADIPIQKVTDYSGEDADLALRIYHRFAPELTREGLDPVFSTIEMPLVPILAEMELAGIRVLPRELAAYSREVEKQLAELEQDIYSLCGRKFNINSTQQLQEILFSWRKLTPVKKTKTGYSTDVDVLEILATQDPVPEKILAHRKASKLKSTYIDALPLLINERTGRLHTHYVQTGAATGRLSSKDPNLQNIPIREEEGRRIRKAFVPAAGMSFISADYAQIELAILASLSQDPVLLESFREGRDIHRHTASLIFGVPEGEVSADQRRAAKTINFGVIYGMSSFGLAQSLHIPRSDADRFIKTYFQRYQGVDAFIKKTIRGAEETGYVRTLFGRRRRIAAIASRNRTEKTAAERVAVNSPIQGTAADIVKLAMARLSRELGRRGLATRLLLQVHDEIILEAPAGETEAARQVVKESMEGVTGDIPLRVDVETGESWGDFH
jgi:DNA polymerase-1